MIRLDVSVQGAQAASARLRELAGRVRDWTPVLRIFGAHMQGSVLRNFELGGRPRWISSKKTVAWTGRADRSPQTLIDRGILKNSFQRPSALTMLDPRTMSLGTNVPYAAVHQEGFYGAVQVGEHTRRVRSRDVAGMVVRVSKKTGKPYKAKVRIALGFCIVRAHAVQMRIPARPFLVVQPEDYEAWAEMAEKYIAGSGQQAGGSQ